MTEILADNERFVKTPPPGICNGNLLNYKEGLGRPKETMTHKVPNSFTSCWIIPAVINTLHPGQNASPLSSEMTGSRTGCKGNIASA